MKRTEAEYKLKRILAEQLKVPVYDFDAQDILLQIQKQIGMLPPNDRYTNSDDEYLLEHYNKWEE